DSFARTAGRHITKNSLGQSTLEMISRVECWNDPAARVLERMKPPISLTWIELRSSITDVVAADERALLLPSEQERLERGWNGVGQSRRQAPWPRAPRLLRLAPVRPSVDRPVSAHQPTVSGRKPQGQSPIGGILP